MTKRRTHSSEQLIDSERLGDIIVGAQVECGDFRLFLLARRQHENRDSGPLADLTNNLGPVHIGKPQIEQDDVWISRLRLRKPVCSSGRLIEAVAMGG